jgi:DNA polymerase beta
MDYKKILIDELNVLRKKEQQDGNTFKAIAYQKVIRQMNALPKIEKKEDLEGIKGIGESIRTKIHEIFETGKLEAAQEVRKDTKMDVIDQFMNIYGIGRVKAVDLVKKKQILSIEDLRKKSEDDPALLNTNQKVGLRYYEDFIERIPRAEMKKHEKMVKKVIQKVSKDLEIEVVGSYRRGEPSSGDIDVLVRWPEKLSLAEGKRTLKKIVDTLVEDEYVTDVLAMGDKKFMGVCKITETARRLDIMITPAAEYAFAVMYFTGSDKFNVGMRKIALEKGYSMNEHGFTPKEGYPAAPMMNTEEDIFRFLGFKVILPKERKNEEIFEKRKL